LDCRSDGLTALVSVAAGKAADPVVLAGNRAKKIGGVGYDPAKLMRSVEGLMGVR